MRKGQERRNPLEEIVEPVEVLAYRPSKAKRQRPWDLRHRGTTMGVYSVRGIPRELQERTAAIARQYNLPVGEVVRLFWEAGLALYERGEINLQPQERQRRATLYPDEHEA